MKKFLIVFICSFVLAHFSLAKDEGAKWKKKGAIKKGVQCNRGLVALGKMYKERRKPVTANGKINVRVVGKGNKKSLRVQVAGGQVYEKPFFPEGQRLGVDGEYIHEIVAFGRDGTKKRTFVTFNQDGKVLAQSDKVSQYKVISRHRVGGSGNETVEEIRECKEKLKKSIEKNYDEILEREKKSNPAIYKRHFAKNPKAKNIRIFLGQYCDSEGFDSVRGYGNVDFRENTDVGANAVIVPSTNTDGFYVISIDKKDRATSYFHSMDKKELVTVTDFNIDLNGTKVKYQYFDNGKKVVKDLKAGDANLYEHKDSKFYDDLEWFFGTQADWLEHRLVKSVDKFVMMAGYKSFSDSERKTVYSNLLKCIDLGVLKSNIAAHFNPSRFKAPDNKKTEEKTDEIK